MEATATWRPWLAPKAAELHPHPNIQPGAVLPPWNGRSSGGEAVTIMTVPDSSPEGLEAALSCLDWCQERKQTFWSGGWGSGGGPAGLWADWGITSGCYWFVCQTPPTLNGWRCCAAAMWRFGSH